MLVLSQFQEREDIRLRAVHSTTWSRSRRTAHYVVDVDERKSKGPRHVSSFLASQDSLTIGQRIEERLSIYPLLFRTETFKMKQVLYDIYQYSTTWYIKLPVGTTNHTFNQQNTQFDTQKDDYV